MLFSSFFVEGLSLKKDKCNEPSKFLNYAGVVELPQWSIGNQWIYDFNFNFDYSVISISGAIKNMKLRVSDINYQKNEYTVDITGSLDASLSIAGILPGGSFTGSVEGYAHFYISTLSIKDFYFESDGWYTFISAHSVVRGTFQPSFDIFDFPINSNEDESNPWDAETSAVISGEITVFDLVTQGFEVSGDFLGEEIYLAKEETHNSYNSLLLKGSTGPSNGGYSNLWYSKDVGYLVDIQEKINNWNGVDATLSMPLISTNFNPSNSPPGIPLKPSGESNGFLEESYTYTTKSIDAEEDPIYYKFSWGDGQDSGWVGPFSSGTEAYAQHLWTNEGDYQVKVKAKDRSNHQTDWTAPVTIHVAPPVFVFQVQSKPFGINASITNNGDETFPQVIWTFRISGGILKLINISMNGSISNFAVGQQIRIEPTKGIFGLGRITVTMTATVAQQTTIYEMNGLVIGPIIRLSTP